MLSLALFQDDRVWFYSRQFQVLLGYDGERWIEHALPDPDDQITGRCDTRGRLMQGYSNRSGGANAWFITNRGVHRFDGNSWSQQTISDGPRHAPRRYTSCPQP